MMFFCCTQDKGLQNEGKTQNLKGPSNGYQKRKLNGVSRSEINFANSYKDSVLVIFLEDLLRCLKQISNKLQLLQGTQRDNNGELIFETNPETIFQFTFTTDQPSERDLLQSIRESLSGFYESAVRNSKLRKQFADHVQGGLQMIIQTLRHTREDKHQMFQALMNELELTNTPVYQKINQIIMLIMSRQKESQETQTQPNDQLQRMRRELQVWKQSAEDGKQTNDRLAKQLQLFQMEISKIKNPENIVRTKQLLDYQTRYYQKVKQLQALKKEKKAVQQQALQRSRKSVEVLRIQEAELQSLRGKLQESQNQNQELKNTISQLQEELNQLKNKQRENILKLQTQLQKANQAEEANKQLRELNKQLEQQLEEEKKRRLKLKSESYVDHMTLFAGHILQDYKAEKIFLKSCIQNHMKKSVKSTEMLYDTKRDYKIPFHERIDNKSNLVIVLQTQNAFIAGYYSGKYAPGQPLTQEGLIISLTNKKRWCLNNFANNPRKNRNDTKPTYGMVYDQFFLIFGNSEIRVKPGDKDHKIFSNFGVSNAYFHNQGDTVDKLLCQGKTTQTQVMNYQLYQVVFGEDFQYVQAQ